MSDLICLFSKGHLAAALRLDFRGGKGGRRVQWQSGQERMVAELR